MAVFPWLALRRPRGIDLDPGAVVKALERTTPAKSVRDRRHYTDLCAVMTGVLPTEIRQAVDAVTAARSVMNEADADYQDAAVLALAAAEERLRAILREARREADAS